MYDEDIDVQAASEKKKILKNLLIIFISICTFFALTIGAGVYWLFYDMVRLPKGKFLIEAASPDGTYSLKAYLINGGATTPLMIRGELVFNKLNHKTKNIYWSAHEDQAVITWSDNDTIIINGHSLDVPHDKFDFRHP